MEIYFTFPSTSAVITAEQVLIAAGMKVKVRPVPGAIRAGCGLCLAVSPDKQKEAMDKAGTNYVLLSLHEITYNCIAGLLEKYK